MQDCVTQRSLANPLITHLPMGIGHDLLHPCWSKVSHIVTTFKLYKIFCCLSFSYTEVLPLPYPRLFIHSIIYLYQDGLRYTYFTLWFISQYYINSLRQLFQFWPSGVVSVWLHVPGNVSTLLFLEYLLTFWSYKMFKVHLNLHFLCSRSRVSHFSKEPPFLFLENGI